MERNTWNNEPDYPNERNRREHLQNSPSRKDNDSYRGAYRLDNSSDHRNQSTWNGFENRDNRDNRRHTDYNQDFNRNYNNDYNRNYNSSQQRQTQYHPRDGQYGNSQQQSNTGNQYRGSHRHDSVHDRIEDRDPYGAGNFNSDYRPDTFGRGGGENYGNMAGSLSYGYDGGNNSDPDWNSRYDPMSGHRRSYHGNYKTRHPDHERDNKNQSNEWY